MKLTAAEACGHLTAKTLRDVKENIYSLLVKPFLPLWLIYKEG